MEFKTLPKHHYFGLILCSSWNFHCINIFHCQIAYCKLCHYMICSLCAFGILWCQCIYEYLYAWIHVPIDIFGPILRGGVKHLVKCFRDTWISMLTNFHAYGYSEPEWYSCILTAKCCKYVEWYFVKYGRDVKILVEINWISMLTDMKKSNFNLERKKIKLSKNHVYVCY